MEIKPPSNDLYTAINRSVTAATQNNLPPPTPSEWKVTQLIQAIITQISDKQLFLDIQGVKANTAKPANLNLQIGDVLKLQIEQLKPMPQFKIISLEKNINTELVANALRNISLQNPTLTPLLKNISYVASRPALRPSPLPADINAYVRDIFKQLPSVFNLKTSEQVKTHLQNSGIFIENKIQKQIFSVMQNVSSIKPKEIHSQLLSNIKPELKLDLGAQLHRLASLIKTQLSPEQLLSSTNKSPQTPVAIPLNNKVAAQQVAQARTDTASLQSISIREEAMQSFLRQIESSLTHMQQTQLQNLHESQAGRPQWLMELPIKNGQDIDVFELRINEEEQTQSEDKTTKIWNVTLQFNLSTLGKIKAHIKMQNDVISTQFYSENSETLTLFQDNFAFLRSRLNQNGLNVGEIACAHAKLSDDDLPINSKRLDERT